MLCEARVMSVSLLDVYCTALHIGVGTYLLGAATAVPLLKVGRLAC